MNTMKAVMEVKGLAKEFVLHQQHGVVLNVFRGLDFTLMPGECLVLHGRSGAGKSTLLRTLYGYYLPAGGSIRIRPEGEMPGLARSEKHTSVLQSLMSISYAVFCLKKKQ